MARDNAAKLTPPYISFRTFLNFLGRLHDDGIPQYIDRHYWGNFLGGSVGQQLMAALRFLDLIDETTNEPTPKLGDLVNPDNRKAALADLLRERYSGIWEAGADPSRATPGHLESAFRRVYPVEGETTRKAVTFFVHAAQFADLPLSSHILAKSRQRRSSTTSTARTRTKVGSRSNATADAVTVSRQPDIELSPAISDEEPYRLIHDLVSKLPKERKWTAERRELWLRALQANVDFLVEVVKADEISCGERLEAIK